MNTVDIYIYIGIFVFACTGALKARTSQMDIFGASVLAFATAYGGGTIRDLLIGVPINWMNDYFALSLVCFAVIIIYLLKKNIGRFTIAFFFTDAIGLGLFTVGGIERSQAAGVNDLYSVIMGVMTATFGGLLGDVLSNRVPSLLTRGELYATACAVGGAVYMVAKSLGLNHEFSQILCVVIVVLIRIVSKKKSIALPHI